MTGLPFTLLDVFTTERYRGNPLAIVEKADGLTSAQMQRIAAQFNLSETIFVQTPADPAHTARVRIFFPKGEIPFAGHPTIGCALHLARQSDLSDVVLEEEAGIVAVTIEGGRTAELQAPVIPYPADQAPDPALIARALGLPPESIGPDRPGTHIGGPRFVYAPLRDADALAAARPMEPAWSELMAACETDSAYLYLRQPEEIRARMFSPTGGIPEDPATGSAAVILASQLMQNGLLPEGTTRLAIRQGVEMGRESHLSVTIHVTGGALSEVRLAGHAVAVASGTIIPPE